MDFWDHLKIPDFLRAFFLKLFFPPRHMFHHAVLQVPRMVKALSLEVIRVGGAGRMKDVFYVSETSVFRAAGRDPSCAIHSRTEEWFSATPSQAKCGGFRQAKLFPSFRSSWPGVSPFLKKSEAEGLPIDASDPWYLPLSAAVFLLLRLDSLFVDSSSSSFLLLVHSMQMLLETVCVSAGNGAAVAARPPQSDNVRVLSAPGRLERQQEIRRAPLVQTPVGKRGRDLENDGHAGDENASPNVQGRLEFDGERVADAEIVRIAEVPQALRDPATSLSLQEEEDVRSAGAVFRDSNTDVPRTATLGEATEIELDFVYCGKTEISNRLRVAGHDFILQHHQRKRGPWCIMFMGISRRYHELVHFHRATFLTLALSFTAKGKSCTGTLVGPSSIVRAVANIIQTPVPLQLDKDLEAFRDQIEANRALFPKVLRSDPSTGESFSPLLPESPADIVQFSTLKMLVACKTFRCGRSGCKVSCRESVGFRRTQMRSVECFVVCSQCGFTTTFFDKELSDSQERLRRAGAVATLASMPVISTLKRWCGLMNLPCFAKLRLFEKRVAAEDLIAGAIKSVAEAHFIEQMRFCAALLSKQPSFVHAGATREIEGMEKILEMAFERSRDEKPEVTALAAHWKDVLRNLEHERAISFDAVLGKYNILNAEHVLLRALMDGRDSIAASVESVGLAGDGAHSRNTRAFGAGNAPTTYVTLMSVRTGAILIQVVVNRFDLSAAREKVEAEAADVYPLDTSLPLEQQTSIKKRRKEYVDQRQAYKYVFNGKAYASNYIQGEAAGLEIALAILRDYAGPSALDGGLTYDDLSSCPSILKRHFPAAVRVSDPWHANKALRDVIEKAESSTAVCGGLAGLTKLLFPSVTAMFKSKSSTVAEKAAWARAWKLPDDRALNPVQASALADVLEQVAGAFEKTKAGFATSMVESYWATHSSFWAKGTKYKHTTIEARMNLQALHWNRVLLWPNLVYTRTKPLFQGK